MQINRLTGKLIQLEPLTTAHHKALQAAAQYESIWQYSSSAYGERFDKWFQSALTKFAQSLHFPFVVRQLSTNQLIGSTRYYEISEDNRRLAIGYTWYEPSVWGTAVNTECKYLLLQYAFEILNTNRVEFIIDSRNSRSRAAVKKLGAIEEGVLRSHIILSDGYVRDSVMCSIIKKDWPEIKVALQSRIAAI